MDQQTNLQGQNQSILDSKKPTFTSEEYIQPNKDQQLHEQIKDQVLLQYEEQTRPEQKDNQQQDYQPLDSYIISKTLGKGNFGKVKLAMHKLTQQYVAVKILQKELIFQNTDIVRITRELKIMKKLRHPFVVQLYEIIETPKQLYLIMEYAQGGDLFQKIVNEERIKQGQAAKIYTQIALGMGYFHSKGVTHRDLKPQNILLSKDGTIKIADFGLGNMFKPEEKLKTACGSPCYASPQMLSREPYDPQKIDIWSSGIILYAMVCGYLPFEDNVTAKLYEKIKTTSVKLPSWVSSPCRNLIRGLLTKDPKLRFDIDTILTHEMIAPHGQVLKQLVIERQLTENKIEQICQMYDIEQREKLVSDLNKNRHNNLTTLYYLGIKRLEKIEKEPKNIDKKNQKEHQNQERKISQENIQQNGNKELQLSSFSSNQENKRAEQMEQQQNDPQSQHNVKEQTSSVHFIQISEKQDEKKPQEVNTPMDDQRSQIIIQKELQNVITNEEVHQQNDQDSITLKAEQKPVFQQKIEQSQMQIQSNESISHKNEMQAQEQKNLSDEQLQVHKLREELTFQQQNIEPTQRQNFSQEEQIANDQPNITLETKLTDSQTTEKIIQQNIHTDTIENSLIQQSYQLSMQIQQTLQQLNNLNEVKQMSNQQDQSARNEEMEVNVDEFHSTGQNQWSRREQDIEIIGQNKEYHPQKAQQETQNKLLQDQCENGTTSIQPQFQQNEIKFDEHDIQQQHPITIQQTQNVQPIQQTISIQSLPKMQSINSKNILCQQQPSNDIIDQQKQIISQTEQQEFINHQQTNSIQHQEQIKTTQNIPRDQIQKVLQQQKNQLKMFQYTEIKPQQNHQSHYHTNFDRQQALLLQQLQQIQSIPTSRIKNEEITPYKNLQTQFNIEQTKPHIQHMRQNHKKNHLFSVEIILPQKQLSSIPKDELQKEQGQAKDLQSKQNDAKSKVKNIFSAKNVRFNERSHSKDTPIVFKSNKNKPVYQPQLQKQDKKKKSLSKSKKISDSRTKKSQETQKIPRKNEKKEIVRQKFVIAKDEKTQKRQILPIKNENKNKRIENKTIEEKNLKIRNILKQDEKIKSISIVESKQSSVMTISKVESKSLLKTSSLISENSKKAFGNHIKAKQQNFDEARQQNIPISPISGMKNKDESSTFKSIKFGFEDQHKAQIQNLKQQEKMKFSSTSQNSETQKKTKKIKIAKPNLQYVYNPVKPTSFSQHSNLNSTVPNGSYSKIQISKISQNTPNNKNKFNKTLGSFSYHNKESTRKQELSSVEFQKFQNLENFGIQSRGNFHKDSKLHIKKIEHDDQQNFTITFSTAQPELIDPELIIFVSVSKLYHLIQSISLSKNINFTHIAGSLTVFEYPSKDYMYVICSNLHKYSQTQTNQKKASKQHSPTKKKSKIGTFEFVELINSIVLTN